MFNNFFFIIHDDEHKKIQKIITRAVCYHQETLFLVLSFISLVSKNVCCVNFNFLQSHIRLKITQSF